ncbi:MAG: hypothetical protein JWL84_989 [Rhodospirillales bacterium]|nr:hypothetical protein [Rhodospirillales bacterium]
MGRLAPRPFHRAMEQSARLAAEGSSASSASAMLSLIARFADIHIGNKTRHLGTPGLCTGAKGSWNPSPSRDKWRLPLIRLRHNMSNSTSPGVRSMDGSKGGAGSGVGGSCPACRSVAVRHPIPLRPAFGLHNRPGPTFAEPARRRADLSRRSASPASALYYGPNATQRGGERARRRLTCRPRRVSSRRAVRERDPG